MVSTASRCCVHWANEAPEHACHRAALQLAVDKAGYGRKKLSPGMHRGVAGSRVSMATGQVRVQWRLCVPGLRAACLTRFSPSG